jgi:uncharacterized phage protein gp47/JayE
MNFNWTDAKDVLDIVDHVLIGLVLIAVAAIPAWFSARNHKQIKKVQDQVVNGHTTRMRDDLDAIGGSIEEIRKSMQTVKSDVVDIRDELRQERKDRINLDDRFESFKRRER